MSKTISEIYIDYKIMPCLQDHMFRVAAVASLICDNFSEPLSKDDIITACLLHDMGNIVKSDLKYFPEFNKPEGIEYWENIKNEYVEKYGKDEFKVHQKIMKEIGISEEVIFLVDKIDFTSSCDFRDGDNFFIKIINYADWRVSPYGVVSYDERMNEAKKRYEGRTDVFVDEGREKLIACGKEIEKQIFAKCKIKPEDINDESVKSVILELKNFVIK